MYYVYVLHSLKDKKLYVGYTADLRRRMQEHASGAVKSTRNRRLLELVYYEAYTYSQEARARESFLKSSDGKKDLYKRLPLVLNKI